MRFVLACEKGHLDDVPWAWFVHAGKQTASSGRCERPELEFRTKAGKGGGLESLEIYCRTCKTSKSLRGITAKDSMRAIGVKCSGKQPWERGGDRSCDFIPQVLQRGASNLYYAATVSALDIPSGASVTESGGLADEIRNHPSFRLLVESLQSESGDAPASLAEMLVPMIAKQIGCPLDEVWKAAGRGPSGATGASEQPLDDDWRFGILREEWKTLIDPPLDPGPTERFAARLAVDSQSRIPSELSQSLEPVVLVERLREVRVLRGFHRITPGDSDRMVHADLGRGCGWLPAHEVYGEGIFLRLKEPMVATWAHSQSERLATRLAAMVGHHASSHLASVLPAPTPRFVLLHTLAHLLVRQLAFECGYTASSLRERIYCADADIPGGPMAGILLYTADADSEGSLGGLVRQGRPDRLPQTIFSALNKATWCSADPICGEAPGQGLFSMNLAACHACSLLSETSCIYSNVLLDRVMVVGGAGVEGFFSPLLSFIASQVS